MTESIWPAGLVTALVTPLKDDAVDLDAFKALIDFQIAGGAAGLVITGGTGEYGALRPDEREALYRAAVSFAGGRVPVFAAPACLSTRETVALCRRAADAGVSGLLLASPFGEPISWEERLAFYREVAGSVALPIMIYNTPPAGLLTFEQIVALSAIDGIDAVKDSSGDGELMGDLTAWAASRGFTVYVGKDSFLLGALLEGASGAVFGVANFVPREISDFVSAVRSEGGSPAVLERWRRLRPLLRTMEKASNYVGLCKAGCGLRGIDVGTVRKPYAMPKDAEVASIKQWLLHSDAGAGGACVD